MLHCFHHLGGGGGSGYVPEQFLFPERKFWVTGWGGQPSKFPALLFPRRDIPLPTTFFTISLGIHSFPLPLFWVSVLGGFFFSGREKGYHCLPATCHHCHTFDLPDTFPLPTDSTTYFPIPPLFHFDGWAVRLSLLPGRLLPSGKMVTGDR